MPINVVTVSDPADLEKAYDIRKKVFVEEQKVPLYEEIDQYEEASIHLLALQEGEPCGACRWRFTTEGIKLERFAVLQEFRGKQVGSALVSACLQSIYNHPNFNDQPLYLNAQLDAIPLYSKFGFHSVGDKFLECEIDHYKMVKR